MAINGDPTPKVIISAAGMCDAGRIRHHLKYNLWRPECTVLFVGYQSPGTLGNALVNGAQEVKLFGEPVQVKARIAQLGGLSGHADKDGLEAWLRAFDEKPKFVFVNHGEDAVAEHWANHLKEEGYEADAPTTARSGSPPRAASPAPRSATPGRSSRRNPPRPCAPARPMTVWPTWASACWRSSVTTGAGPTRTLQNLPARSLRCATNGIDNIDKSKGIWQMLPAPLRGAATLLAVLALAALLTTVRHNASAYLTGVWDTGSQTLVYGRIHQMEQGQYAPGGFLGVYTDDWSDDTNRALFRDDTPPTRRRSTPTPTSRACRAGCSAGSTVCCGTGCPTVWRGRPPFTG